MKYVGVKHQQDNEITCWFSVPEDLEDVVSVGKSVVCDTRLGDMTGCIVSEMDGIPQEVATKIIGNRFPLKNIIAVKTDFILADIVVPWEVSSQSPSPEEISDVISELYEGGFQTQVSFSSDGNLKDGYAVYLVAKMFGHDTLTGYCLTSLNN